MCHHIMYREAETSIQVKHYSNTYVHIYVCCYICIGILLHTHIHTYVCLHHNLDALSIIVLGVYPSQVINDYYSYLESYMDADTVSHMMRSESLITDKIYELIKAAPNDININRLLLQCVRAMDMPGLLKFCNLLKNIEIQHCSGVTLEKCM